MECNLVVLAGRLAIDPEIREFESGTRLARYLITVPSEAPRKRIDVVPVTLWDPKPEHLSPAICRGHSVVVVGAVQRRFWQSAEGRRSRVEIVAHTVETSAGQMPDADAITKGIAPCRS